MAKHIAYCLSCKKKVSVSNGNISKMKNAAKSPCVKGNCDVCGTKVFAILPKK